MNVEPLYEATDLDALPRACPDRPRVAARLKAHPEDFEVEEVPLYAPEGRGDHLFLWVEKRDVAGGDLLKRVAAVLGIPPDEVGSAGTKDRRAVTRQWLSVPGSCADRLAHLAVLQDIRLLRWARHPKKLRTGHLWGNRFRVLLRGADAAFLDDLRQTAATVAAQGFPNFFGTQRFGWSKDTLRTGLARMDPSTNGGNAPDSRRMGHFERRMTVSAVQSALFNRCLALRMDRGLSATVLPGDVLQKTQTGGLFNCTDAAVDQARLDAGEVRLTGPVWGFKMMEAREEAGELEHAVLDEAGLDPRSFRTFAKLAEGTRRALFIPPGDLDARAHPDGIALEFALPKGCYATVLLREFVQEVPREGAAEPGAESQAESQDGRPLGPAESPEP